MPTATRLLFCSSNTTQLDLVKKYGKKIVLLDTTYKTAKYAVPLSFLVVKTNVKYTVVASFALQDETYDAISEALAVIKSWNSEWNPCCFMVDNCDKKIQAIETNFPGLFLK